MRFQDARKLVDDVKAYADSMGCTGSASISPLRAAAYAAELAFLTLEVPPLDSTAVETLLAYPVPKFSPDGACSLKELAEEPYDLRRWECTDDGSVRALWRLNRVCESLHEATQAGWTGIYERHARIDTGVPLGQGAVHPVLVKKAYRGAPSRAEFPLTEEFAARSNNSTVGLSGRVVLVESVREHVATGAPYYECDPAVSSEFCLPITGAPGLLVPGIIDLESPNERHFGEERRSLAVGASYFLSKRHADISLVL